MKFIEKLSFLQDNYFGEWLRERQKTEDEVSRSQHVFCVCGRLATGLHESGCRKFQNEVNKQTVKKLDHLIKK